MIASFLCLLLTSSVAGFAPLKTHGVRVAVHYDNASPPFHQRTRRLQMAEVSVTKPSQEEAETMGIREWTQQAKSKGSFVEACQEGQTLVRYVLDGQGSVQISSSQQDQTISMTPGSLLEVTGEATLSWDVTSKEMIILTPNFEQVGIFAGVALGLVVLLGALIAAS